LLALIYPYNCTEIAYVLGLHGESPIGHANITDYRATDTVSFTVSDPPRGPSASYKAVRSLSSIISEINQKVDRGNDLVRDQGLRLIGDRSGPQRIDQICSIYDYMVDNWTFASDWRGLEQFQYSNYTLRKGMEFGTSGKGDCDDFSILLASLIEAIGGTPRVVFAYGQGGGHAYTEVYLGRRNDSDVKRMLAWLRSEYNSDINYHVGSENEDVWLNMDWWNDTEGARHPGGPFYQASDHIPIYIQEDLAKVPLTSIENRPPSPVLRYYPLQPEAGTIVNFDASESIDTDGQIVDYEWDFGDGEMAHGMLKSVSPHIYSFSGIYSVNLTVTDNEGEKRTRTAHLNVTDPLPVAVGVFSPSEPVVDEAVTFDGSGSKGNNCRIISFNWDFDDGYTGNRATIKHPFLESGTYNVRLTVENEKHRKNTSTIVVVVRPQDESQASTGQESGGGASTEGEAAYPQEFTTITVHVREGGVGGSPLPGVQISASDQDTGQEFLGVTDSTGTAVFKVPPKDWWLFTIKKDGYDTHTTNVGGRRDLAFEEYMAKDTSAIAAEPESSQDFIALKVYVHEGSLDGPLLSGVRITGQDARGNEFSGVTSSGVAVIRGIPGEWTFIFQKGGYKVLYLRYPATQTEDAAVYIVRAQ